MNQELLSTILGTAIVALTIIVISLGYNEMVDKAEKAGYAACQLEHSQEQH
ncbi:hypothetical protein LCGC14_0886700 [marine sediment metagenome]|uniref:Uncharacterized protein n=1 Tax=marine sediment metagenome TaxID=412755 RepID=A0A0F9S7F5_9ZZZZ